MPRKAGVPAYRMRVAHGRKVAVVTLTDAATGQRRDCYLGPFGSAESRERYTRLIAAWERSGRRLTDAPPPLGVGGISVAALLLAYWEAVRGKVSVRHAANIKPMLRRFRMKFGAEPAASIGPVMLRDWREQLARDVSPDAARRATAVVLQLFKWAVGRELVPVETFQRLKCVEPLSMRHVPKRVGPAPLDAVNAVRERVSAQVRAMIDLQLLTGMRPGEVCALRPCDVVMDADVWIYRPPGHKTARYGHERLIYLGPRAQAVLRPFLTGRPTTAFCFSPAEARAAWEAAKHAARRTPLSCGNRPGTNRKAAPARRPGERYAVVSYGQAVARACERAGVTRWHPHQLRHNYATEVRKRHGLEAARILLGHSSALVTEAVYAERDQAAARRIALELG